LIIPDERSKPLSLKFGLRVSGGKRCRQVSRSGI
jgi:hypothetical protein